MHVIIFFAVVYVKQHPIHSEIDFDLPVLCRLQKGSSQADSNDLHSISIQ